MKESSKMVEYHLYIDGKFDEAYPGTSEGLDDAKFDGRNCSCDEHAIYRVVDGVRGKCIERMREP